MTDLHGLNPEKIAFLGDIHMDIRYLKVDCRFEGIV